MNRRVGRPAVFQSRMPSRVTIGRENGPVTIESAPQGPVTAFVW